MLLWKQMWAGEREEDMLTLRSTGTGTDRVKEGDQMKQHTCWQNAGLLNAELLGTITNPPSLSPLVSP